MKKIIVESCGECTEYWKCQPAINDGGNSVRKGFIYPDCPLEDDEPSIPVSKIRERIELLVKDWRNARKGSIPEYDAQIIIKELESLIGENEG